MMVAPSMKQRDKGLVRAKSQNLHELAYMTSKTRRGNLGFLLNRQKGDINKKDDRRRVSPTSTSSRMSPTSFSSASQKNGLAALFSRFEGSSKDSDKGESPRQSFPSVYGNMPLSAKVQVLVSNREEWQKLKNDLVGSNMVTNMGAQQVLLLEVLEHRFDALEDSMREEQLKSSSSEFEF